MLTEEDLILLRHYLEQGLSKTAIADKLGINRRTVHRYIENGKTAPLYGPRQPHVSKLEPFKKYLRGRLEEYPELQATRMLSEIRALGYGGGYSILKDYLRAVRPPVPAPIEERFESAPGEQAQVDFATFRAPFGAVHALLVVLSWSRSLWVRFDWRQDELTVLAGLHRAFTAFGGVPRTVLFDRMRTAVAGSEPDGAAVFNAEMLRFAAHYGFRPRACRPYRAKTKGKIERSVSYLRSGFYYARTFRDLVDLNGQVDEWLASTANARVHGTTGEVPGERLQRERSALLPLPAAAYVPMITVGRRMTRDGYVSYNGNDYSVPDWLEGREVQVRATFEELRLFQDGRRVATHSLLGGRGGRQLIPEHRNGALRDRIDGNETPEVLIDIVDVECRPLEVYQRLLV